MGHKMNKVYLLKHNDYVATDDTVGVYTDRETIDTYLRDHAQDPANYTIIERPLNPLREEIKQGFLEWTICLYLDGTMHRLPNSELIDHTTLYHYPGDYCEPQRMFVDYRGERIMYLVVYAGNEQDAIKIAQEKRLELIESGKWDTLSLSTFRLSGDER